MAAVGGVRGLIQATVAKWKAKKGGGSTAQAAPRGPSPRELALRVQQGGTVTTQSRPPTGSGEARTLGGQTLLGRGG